ILIYAEAKTQLSSLPDAIIAINRIRTAASLPAYTGAVTQTALINEMLKQRRYSLYGEGHRWVDMRRYNKLGELPIDRAGDDVWQQFPRPATEE
ncbi:MAG TPA: RagB/SusD family nutrient uptake outer membrane protein, partial [Niastella sp.]